MPRSKLNDMPPLPEVLVLCSRVCVTHLTAYLLWYYSLCHVFELFVICFPTKVSFWWRFSVPHAGANLLKRPRHDWLRPIFKAPPIVLPIRTRVCLRPRSTKSRVFVYFRPDLGAAWHGTTRVVDRGASLISDFTSRQPGTAKVQPNHKHASRSSDAARKRRNQQEQRQGCLWLPVELPIQISCQVSAGRSHLCLRSLATLNVDCHDVQNPAQRRRR